MGLRWTQMNSSVRIRNKNVNCLKVRVLHVKYSERYVWTSKLCTSKWNLIKYRSFFLRNSFPFVLYEPGSSTHGPNLYSSTVNHQWSGQRHSSMLCTRSSPAPPVVVRAGEAAKIRWELTGRRLEKDVTVWSCASRNSDSGPDRSKATLRLRKRRGWRLMVGEGRLSTSRCYDRIFIGPAWCEAGNRELGRPTAAVMKWIIDSIPSSGVPATDFLLQCCVLLLASFDGFERTAVAVIKWIID
jgi:hypothetical protein